MKWTLLLLSLLGVIQSAAAVVCINGVNQGQDLPCDCNIDGEPYFDGDACENIFLDVTNVSSTPRTAMFSWPAVPFIDDSQYMFVYKEQPPEDKLFSGLRAADNLNPDQVYSQSFRMITEIAARIIDLDSGYVNYTVCVLQIGSDLPNATDIDSESRQCVELQTTSNVLWVEELIFYFVSGFMIFTVILLIILRLICDRVESGKGNESFQKDLDLGIENRSSVTDDLEDVMVIVPPGSSSKGKGTPSSSQRTVYKSKEGANSGSPSHNPLLSRDKQSGSRDHVSSDPVTDESRNPQQKPAFETESMDDFLGTSSNDDSSANTSKPKDISVPDPDY